MLVALLAMEEVAVKVLREDHFANVRKRADNEYVGVCEYGVCVRVTTSPRSASKYVCVCEMRVRCVCMCARMWCEHARGACAMARLVSIVNACVLVVCLWSRLINCCFCACTASVAVARCQCIAVTVVLTSSMY